MTFHYLIYRIKSSDTLSLYNYILFRILTLYIKVDNFICVWPSYKRLTVSIYCFYYYVKGLQSILSPLLCIRLTVYIASNYYEEGWQGVSSQWSFPCLWGLSCWIWQVLFLVHPLFFQRLPMPSLQMRQREGNAVEKSCRKYIRGKPARKSGRAEKVLENNWMSLKNKKSAALRRN